MTGMIGEKTSDRTAFSIVLPVYEDWQSLSQLLVDIEALFARDAYDISVYAVDDCSNTSPLPIDLDGSISSVNAVRLSMNVGHQRAIAVGLVHLAEQQGANPVVVMDADGEDRPEDLKAMIDLWRDAPNLAYVALRKKRSESLSFKMFYWMYVRIFKLLTGRTIRFGNFSILPSAYVARLSHNGNIWNHFAATLLQAKIPVRMVPTVRGVRYAGRSSMNFVSLITHGLGAMSVFSEAIFVRVILLSLFLLAAAAAGAIAVVAVRVFSTMAVPGWATSVLGFAALLSVQAVVTPVLMAFMLLNNRSALQIVPKTHVFNLIERVTKLYERSPVRAVAKGN